MEEIKQKLELSFNPKHAGATNDLLDLISQALQKRDEAILNKIKEYRCHMDEIHCSCMEALVEFINN